MFNPAASSHSLKERVINSIDIDLNLYSDILGALESQQKQLAGRESKRLEETATTITDLLEEAKDNKQLRSQALSELGLENTPDGMEQFLKHLNEPEQSEVSERWQELMERVEECKSVNQVNGRTLNLQREVTAKLLARLNIRPIEANTYSASGQTEERTESMIDTSA